MKIEEITFRINNEDTEDYLKRNGFIPMGIYSFEDIEGTIRIDLKSDGIYCYSLERGSVYGSPLLDMKISFIPETPILDYLLRSTYPYFFIKKK